MMWSKLKQRVEERFADSLVGCVEVFTTEYQFSDGRGWITIDKDEIATFCTRQAVNERVRLERAIESGDFVPSERAQQNRSAWMQAWATENERGIFQRSEFHDALWDSLSLSIDDMLRSENGIIRALAMLDLPDDELPLVRTLYAVRCEAEGIAAFAPPVSIS